MVGKPAITEMLFQHIKKLGMDEVAAQMGKEEGGKEFIERLVAIHKHFSVLFDEQCEGDKDFHGALKQAFSGYIINNKDLKDPHFMCASPAFPLALGGRWRAAPGGRDREGRKEEKSALWAT